MGTLRCDQMQSPFSSRPHVHSGPMKHLGWIAVLVAACSGSDGPVGGPPALGTTPKTWQYVPVDGAQCMNGTPTGIGVNLGTSGDLVIYLEGGGACFNDGTCG